MRVLVTGATGFVGSHLVDAILSDPTMDDSAFPCSLLRVLVRRTSNLQRLEGRDVEQVTGDLSDLSSLREATNGVEVVLHLGALTRASNERVFHAANADGTRNLLDAAIQAGSCRRFVYVSSLAAAGPAPDGRPITAEDQPRPLTAYGRSKLAGEKACRDVRGDLPVVILRPPAVYGPRDTDLLTFFKLAAWGLLPVPTGPGRPIQMIHVQDLTRAVLAAAALGTPSGLYHVAEDSAYPWGEILRLMSAAVGRKGHEIPIPQGLLKVAGTLTGAMGRMTGRPQVFDRDKVRELLAPGWLCDTSAAREEMGFSAGIPLERGLEETARWYREKGWIR
jgi:nucleoside-diphosphate-sugar epimerase